MAGGGRAGPGDRHGHQVGIGNVTVPSPAEWSDVKPPRPKGDGRGGVPAVTVSVTGENAEYLAGARLGVAEQA